MIENDWGRDEKSGKEDKYGHGLEFVLLAWAACVFPKII